MVVCYREKRFSVFVVSVVGFYGMSGGKWHEENERKKGEIDMACVEHSKFAILGGSIIEIVFNQSIT